MAEIQGIVALCPQHPWGHDVLVDICVCIGGPSEGWRANKDLQRFAAASTLSAAVVGYALSYSIPDDLAAPSQARH